MNIKRAKNEIKNALKAYLATDEFGAYRIPPIRQRRSAFRRAWR